MALDDPRERLEAELTLAGLSVREADKERLFVMWQGFLAQRQALRSAAVEPTEEPSYIEKPCQPGGGS
jgi:hypothetical protein